MSDEMKTALLGGVKIAPPEASRPARDAPRSAEITAPATEAREQPRGAAAVLGGEDRRAAVAEGEVKPAGDRRSARTVQPGRCIICTHPKRAQIEMLRAGGATLRAIAKRFGPPLDKDNISRHFRNHVSRERRVELLAGPVRVEELANAAADESRSLLEQLQIVRAVLLNQFLSSAEAGDRQGVVSLGGQLMQALRELGRVTGELRELSGVTINQNTINLFASPEFTALQEGLLKVARAHPAARADIIALLRGLAAASGSLIGGVSAEQGNGATGSHLPVCGLPQWAGGPLSGMPSGSPLTDCELTDAT
jgi:hypothetical protein